MNQRIIKNFAKNYRVDADSLLVELWYMPKNRFDYLDGPNSVVKKKDVQFVKSFLRQKSRPDGITKQVFQPVPLQNKSKYFDFNIGKPVLSDSFLKTEDVISIYQELVRDFSEHYDPIQPVGVKDMNCLESAVYHPQTSLDGILKYPTAQSSAAALMYALSNNHAFHNGNKRTSIVSMLVFLDKHGLFLICDEDALFKISIAVADHKLVNERYDDAEIYELTKWIAKFSRQIIKGERPIRLKKLKHILNNFGCSISANGQVERAVKQRGFFGDRVVMLKSKRHIPTTMTDGDPVPLAMIKSLRQDLQLDADSGIDSESFYQEEVLTVSDFINKYRSLLRRLSKV